MKRKVIQLAGKTLVVSLPSKWARNMGIRKGDEVEVEERDDNLNISTSKKTILEKFTIDATGFKDRTLRWTLSAIHKSGYDEIEILYSDSKTPQTIQEIVKDLFIGFAITEQSKNKCIVRSIAKEIETEYDSTLRRAFLVTISMGESLVEYLQDGKNEKLNDLIQLEHTNNQLTNFCERILIKKGYKEFRKTPFAYVIVWNLEKVCDNYKYIINHILENKIIKITPEMISAIKETNELLKHYYQLYYKFDSLTLNKLVDEITQFNAQCHQMLKNRKEEPVIITYLLQTSEQIFNFSAPYIALNT